MKKRKLAALLMGGIVVLISLMAVVNALSPAPTFEKLDDRVTRYAHDHPDPEDVNKPLAKLATSLLDGYRILFGGSGFGVYQILNIAFYAGIWPIMMLAITVWALKPLRGQ